MFSTILVTYDSNVDGIEFKNFGLIFGMFWQIKEIKEG